MSLDVVKIPAETILPLRDLYRHEMACQIIHDSWTGRGWNDCYHFKSNDDILGYATVGGVRGDPKDTITEFYLLPEHRGAALPLFRRLIELSGARIVEAQTNDRLMTLMLFDHATEIERGPVLFEDGITTHLSIPSTTFRRASREEKDNAFPHSTEPVGDWVVIVDGAIVATGGLLFHYNVPFGDIYMEVAEPHRRKGYGSYLVQELKRECYAMGRIPAARCNPANTASRSTLQKAGMLPCARLLQGKLPGIT